MKRVIVVLILLFLPMAAWAMTPVADTDLSEVIGQAGVNINADLTMNITIGTMAWGDDDGLVTSAYNPAPWVPSATGGYVGMENFNLTNLVVKARTADSFAGYSPFSTVSYNRLKPITIDVATGGAHPGATYVRIGLGSLQINMGNMDVTLGLADHTAFAGNLDQELGQLHVANLALYISPFSYIDIFNDRSAGSQGVTMYFNARVDHWNIEALSWGDSDGLGAGVRNIWFGTAADTGDGWVGLQSLAIGSITVTGTMNIDVAQVSGGVYGASALVSVVRINFDDFNIITAGPITARVRIGENAALNGATMRQFGDIYLTGINANINGWVDIWAH